MASSTTQPSIPDLLGVLADPLRWQLLTALALSDRRVGELTEVAGAPQSLVSYHLAQLRSAGLISSRRSSADGRDTYYRAELGRCGELFARAAATLHPGLRLAKAPLGSPSSTTRRGRPCVLFLCTGNSARSQMAEALLEALSGGTVDARSAGSSPKVLHPNAIRVMAERGIDISGHSTKHVSRFSRSRFDRVVTLCDKVKEVRPAFPGSPAGAHWSMADPAAAAADLSGSYPAFVRTADELDERIRTLLDELCSPQPSKEH